MQQPIISLQSWDKAIHCRQSPNLGDAVVEQAGCLAGAEAIITRNTKDFRRSSIKALDPAELLLAVEM